MKCALLSNVNIESIARRIERHEVHIAQGYGVWTQELADPSSETAAFGPSSVFLIIDGTELLRGQRGLEPMLAELDEHVAWIEQAAVHSPGTKFFVSTVDVPARALLPPISARRPTFPEYPSLRRTCFAPPIRTEPRATRRRPSRRRRPVGGRAVTGVGGKTLDRPNLINRPRTSRGSSARPGRQRRPPP